MRRPRALALRQPWTIVWLLSLVGVVIALLAFGAGGDDTRDARLDGTFIQFGPAQETWTEAEWRRLFERFRALGLTTVIVQWTLEGQTAYYPTAAHATVARPPLPIVMKLAEEAGIDVLVGLAHDPAFHEPGFWSRVERDPAAISHYLATWRARSAAVAAELAPELLKHRRFKGWYISEEIDDLRWRAAPARGAVTQHLQLLSDRLHALAPGRTVAVSTYSSAHMTPGAFGELWRELLDGAAVDLVLFQDGIGVKHLALDALPSYLEAMKRTVTARGRGLWVVTEVFTQLDPGVDPDDFRAEPAPFDRVRRQLETARRFAPVAVAFGIPEYMNPDAGERPRALYDAYRDWLDPLAHTPAAALTRTGAATTEATATKRALIVMDPTGERVVMDGYARYLTTLLGHFPRFAVDVTRSDAYEAGALERYDVTFFVGTHASSVPPAFMRDAYATARTVCWLGGGLDEFARTHDLAGRFGVTAAPGTVSADAVVYKNVTLTKGEPTTSALRVVDPARATVHATARSGAAELPYIVRARNLWLVADNPLAFANPRDRILAFADLLHDIVGEDHAAKHSALIRIEDVNPLSTPEALRSFADFLASEQAPFVISLVPFFVDPELGISLPLSERRDVAAALRYMVSRGGTVAMHGSTHQYRGRSTVDYEFWDIARERPPAEDSERFVRTKLDAAFTELFRNRLYPVLWETPHYAASALAYSVIGRYFSTAMEERLAVDDRRFSMYLPFVIERDLYGQRLRPETLGYVPVGKPEAVDSLLLDAAAARVVRDGFASAFYHPFLDRAGLEKIVQGVKRLGFTYVDVKTLDNVARAGDKVVATGNASVRLALRDQYLRESRFDTRGDRVAHQRSAEPLTELVDRAVAVEPGAMYVAEGTTRSLPAAWEHGVERFLDAVVPLVQRYLFPHAETRGTSAASLRRVVSWISIGVAASAIASAGLLVALLVHSAVARRREEAL